MRKATPIEWKSLEVVVEPVPSQAPLSYPSSAKQKHNWDALDKEASEALSKEKESIDAFFQKIYANANEDTKRAMMKSFVLLYSIALSYLTDVG